MGSLLWSKKPQEAPYAFLKDDEMWKRTEQLFLQGLCVAMGVPPQSPLLITYVVDAVCTTLVSVVHLPHYAVEGLASVFVHASDRLTAGCMALPTLLKYASLSQSEWDKDVQLPVRIATAARAR